jgi:hypothetical protein
MMYQPLWFPAAFAAVNVPISTPLKHFLKIFLQARSRFPEYDDKLADHAVW